MSMDYTVDIERSVSSLANCLRRVNNGINDIWNWRISINAGGIDCGIYFNFDIENKELEISNQPADYAEDSLYLEEIIELINEKDDEE